MAEPKYNKFFIGFDTASGYISGAEYRANMATSGHIDYFSGVVSGHISGVDYQIREDISGISGETAVQISGLSGDLATQLTELSTAVSGQINEVSGKIRQDVSGQIVEEVSGLNAAIDSFSGELSTQITGLSGEVNIQLSGISDKLDTLSGQHARDLQDYKDNIQPGLNRISGEFWGLDDGKTGVSGLVNTISGLIPEDWFKKVLEDHYSGNIDNLLSSENDYAFPVYRKNSNGELYIDFITGIVSQPEPQ
jgi:hypothetical protein